jgi:hypothetical protein
MDAATGVIYEDDTQVREFREPFKWIPGLPKGGGRTEIVFHYLGETPKRKRK